MVNLREVLQRNFKTMIDQISKGLPDVVQGKEIENDTRFRVEKFWACKYCHQ